MITRIIYFLKSLYLNTFIAFCYFLLNLLGTVFRFDDSMPSLINPAAGLSLACLLVLGNRSIPGLLLGIFTKNAWDIDFDFNLIFCNTVNTVVTALTYTVTSYWIKRKIGMLNPLIESNSIILFMLVASMGSLIIALVTTLTYCQAIPISANLLPNMFIAKWISELLGIAIFLPIIMSLIAKPRHIWLRRRFTLALPVLFCFSLVSILYIYLSYQEKNDVQTHLKRNALVLSQEIKHQIQLEEYALYALRNLLLNPNIIDSHLFFTHSQQLFLPLQEIQSVNFINFSGDDIVSHPALISDNKVDRTNKTIKSIPKEARKKLLSTLTKSIDDFFIPTEQGYILVLPLHDYDDQNQAILVANMLSDTLIHSINNNLLLDNFFFKISAFKNSTTDEKIIFNNIPIHLKHINKINRFPIADHQLEISYVYDWGLNLNENINSIEWLMLDAFIMVSCLSMILLYITGLYIRSEMTIDERTSLLMQLKHSAEFAVAEKNLFLANVSHELRTPLHGIASFTQLLEKKSSLNEDDKKFLAIIKQCSNVLLKLINDILELSALGSHHNKCHHDKFNFHQLLSDCVQIGQFKANEKNLTIYINNSAPELFIGDEKRTRQILTNLIDNAIKYTQDGKITIDTEYIRNTLTITVTDTGCGIAEDDIEKIFSPFVQLNHRQHHNEGVGLGLSITKELANLLGGNISVTSTLGVGSAFTVSLPIKPSDIDFQDKNILTNTLVQNLFADILIVDDDEISLMFMENLFGQLGCNVRSAKNGQIALDLLKQFHFDIALIDINMPVMDGLDFAKEVKKQKLKPKIVAVSAYADCNSIEKALKAGFDEYLTKPADTDVLIRLISSVKS